MSENKNVKGKGCGKYKKTFWQGYNLVLALLSLGIPIGLLSLNLISYFEILGYKINVGLNFGNSIALLAAGAAITGTLYSNYQNGLRNEKQLSEARNRLKETLETQNQNLETQLESNQKNLKDQLQANKENLNNQLIHENKTKVLLDIYDVLFFNQKSREPFKNNPFAINIQNMILSTADDGEKINNESIKILIYNLNIFLYLKEIRKNIHSFYYVPKDMQKDINDYIKFIEEETCKNLNFPNHCKEFISNVVGKIKNYPKDALTKNDWITINHLINSFNKDSSQLDGYLNKIYKEIEREVKVKMEKT